MPTRSNKTTSPTRRGFMRGAAALSLAPLAAPLIVKSSALGDDKAAAAGDRLALGFIGMGKMGSGHLNGFVGYPGVEVVAVCDVDTTRREHFRNFVDMKYKELERKGVGECKGYKDYRELLAHPGLDAVLIATPDHWHTAIAIEAAKAKKDIYCEKPLTLTIEEAKAIVDATRKHDRVFQVGSQQRSEGPFRQACEYIRNGRLGKIKEVLVGVGPTSRPCDLPGEPVNAGLDWDMWLGQAPERPYHEMLCRKGLPNDYPFNPGWRDFREYSGGYVTDWGAHHFDITQWALDMDSAGPVEIIPPKIGDTGQTYGCKLIYRGSPVAGGGDIVVTHEKKIYEYDGKNDKGEPQHFVEENGILFIGEKGRLFVNRGKIISEPEGILKEPLTDSDKKLYQSPGHHQDWMNCIQSRKRPIADVEIGARTVTTCHLVNLAYWNGAHLKWDPAKWEFVGDNAAEHNKWRSRPRREKYLLPQA